MTTLHVRPAADRDVDRAADYYAREANLDVASRFLAAIEDGYRRIAAHPNAGTYVKGFDPRLERLRFWPVAGFETHLVFYVHAPGRVEVVRVLHGAQDLQRIFSEETDDE